MTGLASIKDGQPVSLGRLIGGVAGLALLALLFALPYLLGSFYIGLATQILVFAVWVASLGFLARFAGLLSLGHAAFLGIAAYTVGILQVDYGIGFWPAAMAAVLLGVIVAMVFAAIAVRSTGIIFLMITLAQGMIVWGVAQRWTTLTGGDNGLRGISRPAIAQEYWAYYWLVLAIALIVAVVLWMLSESELVLLIRASRDSPTRIESLGYAATKFRFIAFVISGAIASIAGVLYAGLFRFVSPGSVFIAQSVEGVLMLVVGGVGSLAGPWFGATLVIGFRTVIAGYTARWATIMGLLLIVAVLFAPNGLIGEIQRLRRKLTGRAVPLQESPADETRPKQRQDNVTRGAQDDSTTIAIASGGSETAINRRQHSQHREREPHEES